MTDRDNPATECCSPGLCECSDMPRCPKCGYTEHDAAYLMDHHLCDGTIPPIDERAQRATLTLEKIKALPGKSLDEKFRYLADGNDIDNKNATQGWKGAPTFHLTKP